jgi:hypothetical protein
MIKKFIQFNESKKTSEDIDEVKDIFMEYADEFNIEEIKNNRLDDSIIIPASSGLYYHLHIVEENLILLDIYISVTDIKLIEKIENTYNKLKSKFPELKRRLDEIKYNVIELNLPFSKMIRRENPHRFIIF